MMFVRSKMNLQIRNVIVTEIATAAEAADVLTEFFLTGLKLASKVDYHGP